MASKLLALLSGAAVIALFAEGLVVGVLFAKGRLTPETVQEIRDILRDPSVVVAEKDKADDKPHVPTATLDDVVKARALRILQIEQREREQQLLKGLVADSRTVVLKDREAATKLKKDYEDQKQVAADRDKSAAVEQARNVLLKTDTPTMLEHLMKLPLDDSLTLVKGMPEKKIAELLQAFSTGDPKAVKRGQEIFQAIAQGQNSGAQTPADASAKNTP